MDFLNKVVGIDDSPEVAEEPSTSETVGEATSGALPDATPEAATQEASAEPTENEQIADGETEAAADTKYEPNVKYTAWGEEKEMDEWARPLLNKDNEENFRKLFAGQAATERMRSKL